ncbi:hypothetical protein ADIMK_0036 [Marinobacterium lacunae]|uniref:Uncharacterized protein n=1 Tax=Marinobacterium lacunae TaxID=1232683 RepID=A0A081G4L9_9GAMM|nr:hypothetical protein [Marinobacterium lacunae]KEA65724.1 hypothetical protein ADIMK_0036 [Marinobacterium lacunae]MBR9883305.1 hypothetical protein [Oceanospirillales bacterium]
MRKILLSALVVVSLPVLAAKPEWVDDKHQGKKGKPELAQESSVSHRNEDHGKERDRADGGRYELRDRLSVDDRDRLLRGVLVDHYGVEYQTEKKRYKSLPPGLRKKLERGGELPPGWRDKLVRGEVIDPVIYRNAEHLPSDLLNRLTGRQDGIELLRVGDRIVRVMEGRGTVLDVIDLTDRALGLFE